MKFEAMFPVDTLRDVLNQVLGRTPRDPALRLTQKAFWIGGCIIETYSPDIAPSILTAEQDTIEALAIKISSELEKLGGDVVATSFPMWLIPLILRLIERLIAQQFQN